MLLFFCCYRRRQRSKARQVDSEKAGSEESGSEKDLDQPPAARPGFFSRFRKQGTQQAVSVTPRKATPANSLPRTPEAQKTDKREGQGWNFVARALPWRSPSKTPPSPISPGGSDKSRGSNLSDHAAKAALKYKAASPRPAEEAERQEFTGPGFNPVRISGGGFLQYES